VGAGEAMEEGVEMEAGEVEGNRGGKLAGEGVPLLLAA